MANRDIRGRHERARVRVSTRRAGLIVLLAGLLLALAGFAPEASADSKPSAQSVLDGGNRLDHGDDVQWNGSTEFMQALAAEALPLAAGGYTLIDSQLGIARDYQIRIVTDDPQWASLQAPLRAAIIQLNSATGANYFLGSPTSQHTGVLNHQITVSLGMVDDCGNAGCTIPGADWSDETDSYLILAANIFINPDLLVFPGVFFETVLHELGHAAALNHFDSNYEGTHQVMRSWVDFDYHNEFQTGDQNGLARTAATGFAHGYLIPRACLPTLVDVRQNSTFCVDIRWMLSERIASGFADGTFRPLENLSRQGAASFLYKLAGSPAVPAGAPNFTDVPVGHPFRSAIRWLASEGIASGFADGTFRPTDGLSRQGMASFLYKMAGSPPVPAGAPTFSDVPTGHPFHTAISWMAGVEITTGFGDGTFRPAAGLSRQAMSAFVHRFYDLGLVP